MKRTKVSSIIAALMNDERYVKFDRPPPLTEEQKEEWKKQSDAYEKAMRGKK